MPREERAQTRLAMTMAEDRHADFGTFLRQAREQRGVSLQELAVTTKISARVLEAARAERSEQAARRDLLARVRARVRPRGRPGSRRWRSPVSSRRFPTKSGADEMPATTSAVEAESFEQRRRARPRSRCGCWASRCWSPSSRSSTTRGSGRGPDRAGPDRAEAPAASRLGAAADRRAQAAAVVPPSAPRRCRSRAPSRRRPARRRLLRRRPRRPRPPAEPAAAPARRPPAPPPHAGAARGRC